MQRLQILTRLSRLGLRAALVSAAVLALASCSDVEAPAVPEGADSSLVEGREVWQANCSRCHGGAGGGGAGPSLKGPWSEGREPDAAAMVTIVTEGRGAMPRFGNSLSPDEIEAVVRYVREVL